MNTENKIKEILITLGLSTNESIESYFSKVRDREDVSVLRCKRSGVILLSRTDHMDLQHYETKESFRFFEAQNRKTALLTGMDDAQRRFDQFKNLITNKKWIDMGTGPGGILDLLSPLAKETIGVEPQDVARKSLTDKGYEILPSILDVKNNYYEVVTLFHVLEHFTNPIFELRRLRIN